MVVDSNSGSPTSVRNSRSDSGGRQEPRTTQTGHFFMLVLALQFGLQPVLQKACVDQERVDRLSLMIATEVFKIVLCFFVIVSSGPKVCRSVLKSWNLQGSLSAAALPAAGYVLQSWLAQLAYVHLDSLTFNLLNQTKTLFAALCLYLVMGKKQTLPQLLALICLVVAALLLKAGPELERRSDVVAGSGMQGAAAKREYDRLWLGVLPVLAAAFLSGLLGAITQRTLQRSGRNTSQLSLELAVYGLAMLLLTSALQADGATDLGSVWRRDLFRGWTRWTLLPVLSQAAGGVVVGQVTKHAGSVKKGFALIGGILVTAAVQSTLEKTALTSTHWAAAALVVGSTYLHSTFLCRGQDVNKKTN